MACAIEWAKATPVKSADDLGRTISVYRRRPKWSQRRIVEATEFRAGNEVYEVVCALSRFGLSLPPHRAIPDERDREMLRLRIVEDRP
jgi:hypothetical protein